MQISRFEMMTEIMTKQFMTKLSRTFRLFLVVMTSAVAVLSAQNLDTIAERVLRLSPAKQYRYFHQQLERYFESGNSALLDTLLLQAREVEDVYGSDFFVKLSERYRNLRNNHLETRRQLKTVISSAATSTRTEREEAIRGFRDAAQGFLRIGDTLSATTTLQHMAFLQSTLGRAEYAEATLHKAIDLSRDYGDDDALARSHSLLGGVYLNAGDYLHAGESFDSARVIRTVLYDTAGVAVCLTNIAAVYQAVGQRVEAYRFTTEALRRFEQIGDSSEALDANLNLVSSFSDLQTTDQLQARLTNAETLMPEDPTPHEKARLAYGKAVLLERKGNTRGAYDLCEDALAIDHNDASLQIALHNLAGSCSVRSSRFDSARSHYESALEIATTQESVYGLTVTLNNLGSLNQRLGRLNEARLNYDSALALIQTNPGLQPGLIISTNLFDLYLTAGDTATALAYLEQAGTISASQVEESGFDFVSAAARFLAADGKVDSALNLIDSARVVLAPECQTDFDLTCLEAEILRTSGRLDQAYTKINEAERLLTRCSSEANMRKLRVIDALCHFDRGEWAKSAGLLAGLITDIEESQASLADLDLKLSYLSKSRFLYEKMAVAQFHRYRLTGEEQFADSILKYAEFCKARGLRALLQQENLSDKHNSVDPPSIRQVRENMTEDAALLYYLLTLDGSLRLLITRNDFRCDLLPGRVEITNQVAEYARLIQRSISDEAKLDSVTVAGSRLGETVLDKIIDRLDNLSRLFVSADGALELLPFSSLVVGEDYLVQRVAVTNLPAIEVRTRFEDDSLRFRQSLDIIAVGISDAGGGMAPLKHAPQEVNWIAQARSNDHVTKLIDSMATPSKLRSLELARADVIHLATHTTISYSNPEKSVIWLVSPDGDSGSAVTPADLIPDGNLEALLVVLSACESGGGSYELSEGLMGFAQQFLSRGSRYVLITHWEVEDFTSSVLMKSFYSNLDAGPAVALQRAQVELLESPRLRHRHPYFWAPFILIKAP